MNRDECNCPWNECEHTTTEDPAPPEKHVVEFTETGYGLEHPRKCREDGRSLLRCDWQVYLAAQNEPLREPGRYVMEWSVFTASFIYVRLAATEEAEVKE